MRGNGGRERERESQTFMDNLLNGFEMDAIRFGWKYVPSKHSSWNKRWIVDFPLSRSPTKMSNNFRTKKIKRYDTRRRYATRNELECCSPWKMEENEKCRRLDIRMQSIGEWRNWFGWLLLSILLWRTFRHSGGRQMAHSIYQRTDAFDAWYRFESFCWDGTTLVAMMLRTRLLQHIVVTFLWFWLRRWGELRTQNKYWNHNSVGLWSTPHFHLIKFAAISHRWSVSQRICAFLVREFMDRFTLA